MLGSFVLFLPPPPPLWFKACPSAKLSLERLDVSRLSLLTSFLRRVPPVFWVFGLFFTFSFFLLVPSTVITVRGPSPNSVRMSFVLVFVLPPNASSRGNVTLLGSLPPDDDDPFFCDLSSCIEVKRGFIAANRCACVRDGSRVFSFLA